MDLSIFALTLKVPSARRKRRRWNIENIRTSHEARGTVMVHYLVYKLLHKDTNLRLNRDQHLKIKNVFEKQDFDYIRSEMKAFPKQTVEEYLPACKKQVKNFRILHHQIGEMKEAGLPYLHSLFNGLVKGVFTNKKLYDSYYFRTPIKRKKNDEKAEKLPWDDCLFHEDIEVTDGIHPWNFTDIQDESPISIYFPIGDKPISLDMATQKTISKNQT